MAGAVQTQTAVQQAASSFSPIVDGAGNISFPANFPDGYQHIGTYLTNPRGFIPGNRMARLLASGVAAADDRDAIAAYLATLK